MTGIDIDIYNVFFYVFYFFQRKGHPFPVLTRNMNYYAQMN